MLAVLTVLFATVSCQSTSIPSTTETTTITTESTTSEQTTSTETTTSEVTTITSVPTSTSTEPTTTSVKPTTTTSTAAPTTSVAPTTTSIAPSTTPVVPSTKAPEPTPPPYEKGSWNVTQNNVTCIRVEMKALFTIVVGDRKEYVALSENATTDGSTCELSNTSQVLVLTERERYTLTMVFIKDGKNVFVNDTVFEYNSAEGPVAGSNQAKHFTVDAGHSYKCTAVDKIVLGNVTMDASDVHIQAFGAEGNTNFSQAESCDADDRVSDAVPIAVGCALAALIIVVLIAYLVGRRNSRQKGYQSV